MLSLMSEENKNLILKFNGRILDQLGIQTYHTPAAAISELISNAWDADASVVKISIPESIDEGEEIVIEDNGIGMSFNDCQDKYLNVGYNRRGSHSKETSLGGRPILGRKGIGKFAGFGIAEIIHVKTTSSDTGEITDFKLDINKLRHDTYISETPKNIDARYHHNSSDSDHGTKITLKSLNLSNVIRKDFKDNLSRKFLLHRSVDNFKIMINEEPLEISELKEADVRYEFPRDYDDAQSRNIDEDGWCIESIDETHNIAWKVQFTRDTIKIRDFQGITIFVNGKLAQNPFFFELVGGIGGQAGQSYMTGQIKADYIDEFDDDLISPERQRINWNMPQTQTLYKWGEKRVKELLIMWHNKRGEERMRELEDRMSIFKTRLEKLDHSKRAGTKKILNKIGSISTIADKDYQEIAISVILAIEKGRLDELWEKISNSETFDTDRFLSVLTEAGVISALTVAEYVKTNLLTISQLKKYVTNKEYETKIRDYVAEHPQLLGPEWELFKQERSLKKTIGDIGAVTFKEPVYDGRVDLILRNGDELLIIEFMRPGLEINWEHVDRCRKYVLTIQSSLSVSESFNKISALIIADIPQNIKLPLANNLDDVRKSNNIRIHSWDQIITRAVDKWRDYLEILVGRTNNDPRLEDLINGIPVHDDKENTMPNIS